MFSIKLKTGELFGAFATMSAAKNKLTEWKRPDIQYRYRVEVNPMREKSEGAEIIRVTKRKLTPADIQALAAEINSAMINKV